VTERFDLVIAGGGPSGSAAAWQAAQTGAKVVVLDKAVFPRDKPCGDGLTARAVSYLQHMGLADQVAQFHRINRVTVYSPSRWELSFPKRPGMPDHGLAVSRTELDTLLLKHAESAGAVVADVLVDVWLGCAEVLDQDWVHAALFVRGVVAGWYWAHGNRLDVEEE